MSAGPILWCRMAVGSQSISWPYVNFYLDYFQKKKLNGEINHKILKNFINTYPIREELGGMKMLKSTIDFLITA